VNQKAYLAGSLDARDGTVLWVGDCVKNSGLFVRMLESLDAHYRDAKLIHVILDNYGIHKSHETRLALMRLGRCLALATRGASGVGAKPVARPCRNSHGQGPSEDRCRQIAIGHLERLAG
jgi:hypothetical protein